MRLSSHKAYVTYFDEFVHIEPDVGLVYVIDVVVVVRPRQYSPSANHFRTIASEIKNEGKGECNGYALGIKYMAINYLDNIFRIY